MTGQLWTLRSWLLWCSKAYCLFLLTLIENIYSCRWGYLILSQMNELRPPSFSATWLTVKHGDWNGLLLLDSLSVREASVANVVRPAVFRKDIGEVQITIQSLGHPFVQREPMEVWQRHRFPGLMCRFSVQICVYADDPLLSIQKMTGGGRPAGGRHCNTSETPFCTTIASFLSFDHKGDPASQINNRERCCIILIMCPKQ